MFKPNIVPRFMLSAFALTTLCLLPAGLNAQKAPQGTTGAPLKSVDVKLGKNPGGSPAARTTTDPDGNFIFPVVPEGQYILIVEPPKDTDSTKGTVKWFNGEKLSVTLNLPGGKKIVKDYDTGRPAIDRKIHGGIIVVSDGITATTGTIIIRNPNGK